MVLDTTDYNNISFIHDNLPILNFKWDPSNKFILYATLKHIKLFDLNKKSF
jgi:hypothetical protein